MWGNTLQSAQERSSRRNPWHEDEYLRNGQERIEETPESGRSSDDSPDGLRFGGTWGERDAGGIDTRLAAEDLAALRGELVSLSKTRSQGARSERSQGLSRTLSRKSTRQSIQRRASISTQRTEEGLGEKSNEEPGDIGAAAAEKDTDFELDEFMREGHFEKRKNGKSAKKVGVLYKHLTVKGVGSTTTFVKTLPQAIMGTFGPDLYRIVTNFVPALRLSRHKQTRVLINDFSGVVKDGEMMLVLGRPGSGCSTFLKAIANNRESYAAVEGEVSYGGKSNQSKLHLARSVGEFAVNLR